jgi:hypothetical protein
MAYMPKVHHPSHGERGAEGGIAEDVERHQRAGLALLPIQKQRARYDEDCGQRENGRRCEAPVRSLDGHEGQGRERDDHQRLARQVEAAAFGIARLGHAPDGEEHRQHADRNDEGKDAAPAGGIDQQAADRRADRERKPVATRPDADGAGALLRIGIGYGEDRKRGRNLQRGADSGHRPACDQHGAIGCDRAHD